MKINIETKFNIGDTVYFISVGRKITEEEVFSSEISSIIFGRKSFAYIIEHRYIEENRLYATKEEAEEKLKKRRIKVYLSGAIASDKNYISKFMTAKEEVKKMGFSVLNPIETDESMHDEGAKEYMFASIELLRQADVMLLLDKDLTKSKGVQIEIALAKYCNIPVANQCKDIEIFTKEGRGEK